MSKNPHTFPRDIQHATEDYVMQSKVDEWCNHRGLKKQVYIDTFDAIHLIQGIWGLWEYKRQLGNPENLHAYVLNETLLQSPNTLVHSFAFRGNLGPIRLLPPHQDELAEKIREDKRLFFTRGISELTHDLWHKLGLLEFLDEAENPNLENFEIYLHRSKARDLYVAKDLLLIPYWQDRYHKLFNEDKIIEWDDTGYNFGGITGKPEFKIILRALDEERNSSDPVLQKHWERSNYADAIAFCILKERLDAFKKDPGRHALPLFFASKQGTFNALKKVMSSEKGAEMFTYKFQEDGRTWEFQIVRDAHYFVLDAIFNEKHPEGDPLHELFVQLRATCDREVNDYALLDRIFGNGTKAGLEKRITDLLEDEFFNNIWARHESYKEYMNAVLANRDFQKRVEKVEEKQEEKREKIILGLHRNTDKFKLANEIIENLFQLEDPADKSYYKNISNIDVFSDLSMVRFSFTRNCRKEIQNYVNELLRSRGTVDFKLQARSLLMDIMNGLEDINTPQNAERLTIGLAVLWVFKKYDLIAQIADRLNFNAGEEDDLKFPNYQIPLLYAAAVSRGQGEEKQQLAKRIAECIEKKFSPTTGVPNYKAWLGLAYVWWNIWIEHHNSLELPEQMGKARFQKCQEQKEFAFVQKAQSLTNAVIEFLTTNKGKTDKDDRMEILNQRDQKYYYALNMKLFLNILYAGKQEFMSDKNYKLLLDLEAKQGQLPWWHSRYYDTCARYYFRRALLSANAEVFEDMLKQSKRDNDRCIEETKIYEGIDYNRALERDILLKRADKYKGWHKEYRRIN